VPDGFDRQTAGARFRPGKVMLVEQQYGLSGGGEVIGGPRSRPARSTTIASHSWLTAFRLSRNPFAERALFST